MIEQLKGLGLTDYEARAYLILLQFGVQQGRAIAKHSGVPPTRVFDALHSLVTKKFASKVQDKPLLFKAIPPEQAIKYSISTKQANLKLLEKDILSELKEVKTEIPLQKVTEKINILPGYDSLWAFVNKSLNTAKKELKLMFTYEQRPKGLLYLMKKALDRGIKIKIISTKMTDEGLIFMKEHINLGVEVKYYPVQELRFTIKDGEESLITMINPKDRHDRVNIIIDSLDLSRALDQYFNVLWKKAKNI